METSINTIHEKNTSSEQIASALKGCSSFFETLAALYYQPLTQCQIDDIAKTDLSAYAPINEHFAAGVNDITRYLRKRNTGTREDLAVDFTSAFGGTSSWEDKAATPYASIFIGDKGLLYGEAWKNVLNAYKSEYLRLDEGIDLPEDHLSFMLQFVAILLNKAACYLENENEHEAAIALKNARSFLLDNIDSWFDSFSELSLRILQTRFYRGVLEMTRGMLDLTIEVIDDALENAALS